MPVPGGTICAEELSERENLLRPMTFGLYSDPNNEVAPREIHSVREKAKKAKKKA